MKIARPVAATAKELKELRALVEKGDSRTAMRARIVLACTQGARNMDVAEELGVSKKFVHEWRTRFADNGMAALRGEVSRDQWVRMRQLRARTVPLAVSVPRTLYQELVSAAQADGVSLSHQVLRLLTESLKHRLPRGDGGAQ